MQKGALHVPPKKLQNAWSYNCNKTQKQETPLDFLTAQKEFENDCVLMDTTFVVKMN
jgi:hypothetical protein